jgi:protein TonB
MTKDFSLASSFVASLLIHLAVVALATVLMGQRNHRSEQNLISTALLDATPEENMAQPRKDDEKKTERPKEPPARTKRASVPVDPPAPKTAPTEVAKPSAAEISPATVRGPHETTLGEGGGSETEIDNLAAGKPGVPPGSGSTGGGTGTAGLGRGSGAPGLPAEANRLRVEREAKPIQTARASYPPMALRMGLEGDVTLRIEVDPEGKVTKAEIIKSGGPGFDEEAVKAVTQSRFEPAQRDGQNIAAEFSYIYRFRLRR